MNSITFCLVIYNCSNPVEPYGELKGKTPFHLPQKGTVSLLLGGRVLLSQYLTIFIISKMFY